MLAELDVVVYLKTSDPMELVAQRVFGSLGSDYWAAAEEVAAEEEYDEAGDDEAGELAGVQANSDSETDIGAHAYEASGMGFLALLFRNEGEDADPEFEEYGYGLQLTSRFWCVELDTVDLEGPLSEYFARELAFDLNLQTATEVLLETTEEAEVFEARAFRRNPQYRLDQAPTTPKVFVVERRQYEQGFEDEAQWSEADEEDLLAPSAVDEEPADEFGEQA